MLRLNEGKTDLIIYKVKEKELDDRGHPGSGRWEDCLHNGVGKELWEYTFIHL